MDRAYEGNETRQLALELGFPVVSRHGWRHGSTEVYKRRNEVERFFRRLKGFLRIFSTTSTSRRRLLLAPPHTGATPIRQ